MRYLLIIAFLFLIVFSAPAQSITDSLRKLYMAERNDSLKIDLHLKYINELLQDRNNAGSAEKEITVLQNSNQLKSYPAYLPWLFYYKALTQLYKTEYVQSIISLNEAERSIKDLPESENLVKCRIKIYQVIGGTYSDMNDWENAQTNYQKAIRYAEQQKDSSSISRSYLNIAFIFIDSQDWLNASINLHKSLMYTTSKDPKRTLITLFSTLANAYTVLNDQQKAWMYILKSDSVLQLEKTPRGSLFNSLCRGEYFYYSGQYNEALKYCPLSLQHAREYGDSVFIAVALEQNGKVQ